MEYMHVLHVPVMGEKEEDKRADKACVALHQEALINLVLLVGIKSSCQIPCKMTPEPHSISEGDCFAVK